MGAEGNANAFQAAILSGWPEAGLNRFLIRSRRDLPRLIVGKSTMRKRTLRPA